MSKEDQQEINYSIFFEQCNMIDILLFTSVKILTLTQQSIGCFMWAGHTKI